MIFSAFSHSVAFALFGSYLTIHHLVDSTLMAVLIGEGGRQPGFNDGESQILIDYSSAEGHHIGIVVQTGHFCGIHIGKQSTANAINLISGNGNANAGGAKHDALITVAISDSPGGCCGIVRVIAAFG